MAAGDIDWDIVAEGIVAKVGVARDNPTEAGIKEVLRVERAISEGLQRIHHGALSLQREAIGVLRCHLY